MMSVHVVTDQDTFYFGGDDEAISMTGLMRDWAGVTNTGIGAGNILQKLPISPADGSKKENSCKPRVLMTSLLEDNGLLMLLDRDTRRGPRTRVLSVITRRSAHCSLLRTHKPGSPLLLCLGHTPMPLASPSTHSSIAPFYPASLNPRTRTQYLEIWTPECHL